MNERRRPGRRGRRPFHRRRPNDAGGEPSPYRDAVPEGQIDAPPDAGVADADGPAATEAEGNDSPPRSGNGEEDGGPNGAESAVSETPPGAPPRPDRPDFQHRQDRDFDNQRNGRRHRRHRGRGRRGQEQQYPPTPVTADSETLGWFDPSRDGGFIRRAASSYLAEPGDAWIPPHVVRQYALRQGDMVFATAGRDHRGRVVVVEVKTINDVDPAELGRRPDFQSLTATYPERRLTMETGRPARGGPELTRRCIDLMAPIGYGQRALIVAPARAGKTMLLHALTEGIALNHPNAVLLILLVDERPEEVSEAISWGVGEVIASSFDQPANRHVEVCEMVLEHARRLVEMGKDVVIVLDSLTRMARAHNTAERGSGRTLSGGLDSTAMAKPKAFFGSARAVHPKDGGGSLTIISTALVETGSRMDDVIFEEFKGTGNCEIKLDRSLAEKRIFPAFDIAASGTRREEKLYRPDQLDAIYTLRRGLQQMPPQAAMEWMIKRIASTPNNDALLTGL
ncbi:MAG TPA: transcription termination factor Rho [Gemmatimonadaceae bacterium]|nr:transcription termination factor Rho [Gemmatimonadaceae bacterium]